MLPKKDMEILKLNRMDELRLQLEALERRIENAQKRLKHETNQHRTNRLKIILKLSIEQCNETKKELEELEAS